MERTRESSTSLQVLGVSLPHVGHVSFAQGVSSHSLVVLINMGMEWTHRRSAYLGILHIDYYVCATCCPEKIVTPNRKVDKLKPIIYSKHLNQGLSNPSRQCFESIFCLHSNSSFLTSHDHVHFINHPPSKVYVYARSFILFDMVMKRRTDDWYASKSCVLDQRMYVSCRLPDVDISCNRCDGRDSE